MDKGEFTAQEKFKEAEREVKLRRQVYPRLVEARKLSKQTAERQIAIMLEIMADYELLAQKGRLL